MFRSVEYILEIVAKAECLEDESLEQKAESDDKDEQGEQPTPLEMGVFNEEMYEHLKSMVQGNIGKYLGTDNH